MKLDNNIHNGTVIPEWLHNQPGISANIKYFYSTVAGILGNSRSGDVKLDDLAIALNCSVRTIYRYTRTCISLRLMDVKKNNFTLHGNPWREVRHDNLTNKLSTNSDKKLAINTTESNLIC